MNKQLFSIVSVVLLSVSSVAAKDTTDWKRVGNWDVAIDHTLGNGCFMVGSYEGGTHLRIGVDRRENSAYLMFGNEEWRSLEAGKEYPIEIHFGNRSSWDADARVLQFPDGSKVLSTYVDAEFIETFMRQTSMSVHYRGRQIDSLKLPGTFAAFIEVMECQDEVDQYLNKNGSDPFVGNVSSQTDPFL
ncbi:hypothetical protein [Ruegeria lacuscaerulensis]|uniref:hypothetical protein n=1 Tax=Ruegeria lacuscaerulensis TaxID=55218 RepID=UPI00147F98F4|nr:hypothetical protein [Ruegeria lacuscaerulensis]